MTLTDTDILAGLIGRKRDHLLTLREMGRRQMEFVADGEMARLLDVLAAKQRVLNDLQRVERALDPFRDQDPEARIWPSTKARADCAKMLDECEQLLRETVEQERKSEAALTLRRDEAAVRLHGAHAAGRARGAYVDRSPSSISQLDLSSES
jgi:hypothetical protein